VDESDTGSTKVKEDPRKRVLLCWSANAVTGRSVEVRGRISGVADGGIGVAQDPGWYTAENGGLKMQWATNETTRLRLSVDRIALDLFHPLDLAVACSGRGDLAFELARRFPHSRIVGLELDHESLSEARRRATESALDHRVEFLEAEQSRIPLPSGRFGGFVSDYLLFPTRVPTEFGQSEIARILKPGGTALITDLVVERPLDPAVRLELRTIGLDYLRDAECADFRRWLNDAGLTEVCIDDLTPLVRPVWEARSVHDPDPGHRLAYSLLLDRQCGLGGEIFYVYVRARKPRVAAARRVLAVTSI
jgi:SAM-dependent methyltransferase